MNEKSERWEIRQLQDSVKQLKDTSDCLGRMLEEFCNDEISKKVLKCERSETNLLT